MKTISERVESNIVRIPFAECWYWRLAPGSHGYGQMMFPDHKPRLAHRLVYEHYVGPIPDGLHVLHRCDNRACCNPSHLFLGTPKDNMRDCVAKKRNSPPPVGANRKLTEAQQNEIVARFRGGEKCKAIASDYGIHYTRVYQLNREYHARQNNGSH